MIIGLTGDYGAGKDTVADYILSYPKYVKIAFADPIYDMLAAMLGTTVANIQEHKRLDEGVLGLNYRHLLETLGHNWGREIISPDLWVRIFDAKTLQYDNVVVPDVRYWNEAEYIRSRGGVILLVGTNRATSRCPYTEYVHPVAYIDTDDYSKMKLTVDEVMQRLQPR
jgi:hypothetical protein